MSGESRRCAIPRRLPAPYLAGAGVDATVRHGHREAMRPPAASCTSDPEANPRARAAPCRPRRRSGPERDRRGVGSSCGGASPEPRARCRRDRADAGDHRVRGAGSSRPQVTAADPGGVGRARRCTRQVRGARRGRRRGRTRALRMPPPSARVVPPQPMYRVRRRSARSGRSARRARRRGASAGRALASAVSRRRSGGRNRWIPHCHCGRHRARTGCACHGQSPQPRSGGSVSVCGTV